MDDVPSAGLRSPGGGIRLARERKEQPPSLSSYGEPSSVGRKAKNRKEGKKIRR
jgi:hypothetical protein